MNTKEFNRMKALLKVGKTEKKPVGRDLFTQCRSTENGANGTENGGDKKRMSFEELMAAANNEAPKERVHKEAHEEKMHMTILREMAELFPGYAPLLVHNCNEFRGTAKEGGKRKAMGVRKGFPDLTFFMGTQYYHGLHIELKWGKNNQSTDQKYYEHVLTKAGYQYVVCRSVEEFIKGINQYILLGRWGEEKKTETRQVSYLERMEDE